jgi:thiamine pyrophosphokinase
LKFKRAVILAAGITGEKEFFSDFFSEEDYIICADGGLKNAEYLGLSPDLIVGDMDSYDGNTGKFSCKIISFSREKDKTDTELAMEYARDISPQEIIIIGALGRRFDHSLGNVHLLLKGFTMGIPVIILDSYQRIDLVWKDLYIDSGKAGGLISLLPFSGEVKGIVTSGLKYPLENETLYPGETRGISNEILQIPFSITVKSGLLLVIRNFIDL